MSTTTYIIGNLKECREFIPSRFVHTFRNRTSSPHTDFQFTWSWVRKNTAGNSFDEYSKKKIKKKKNLKKKFKKKN